MVPSWPSFEGATLKSFDEIALAAGTDKASNIHGYCEKYERYLGLDRNAELLVLEIGIYEGASLQMWRDYLERAKIVGIDINPACKRYEDLPGRIHVEIGSQDDAGFLSIVKAKHGPFDMVLDDGSHLQQHVIASFRSLWDAVKPGGIYVVEDSVTSYWPDYGGGLKKPDSMVEFFKAIVDEVHFFGEGQKTLSPPHARRDDGLIRQFEGRECLGTTVESIQFLNSIIVLRKRR